MNLSPIGGHRKVTIMGLGTFGGGLGAARFWQSLGSEVTVTDLRSADELAGSLAEIKGVRLVLGKHELEDFSNADLVMVNPAVAPGNKFVNIAREAGATLQTEVGLAITMHRGPFLAVTGSNGKSTTTALLGKMLQHDNQATLIGGNIGGSVLESLKDHLPSAPLVMELSSFQLYYLRDQKIAPDVAIVTNLTPNHLDWHKNLLHYYESKRNLVRFQREDQYAVLNYNDSTLREWESGIHSVVCWTAIDDPHTDCCCFVRDNIIVLRINGEEVQLADLKLLRLPGAHNISNALQACAGAYLFNHKIPSLRRGLNEFTGLPHRLEKVAEISGRSFINDSIATTPESAICGLQSFEGRPVVIIAGGYDKGMSLEQMVEEVVKRACGAVVIGQTGKTICELIEKHSADFEFADCDKDFELAIRRAYQMCPEGGVVLLSPGCASYGMFTNFTQRGEEFARIARSMSV